jgi:Zn-dependent protease with chaperone function
MSLSLAGRALIALIFMIGFYALAFGIAGGLLYLPYAEWVYAGRIHFRLGLFSVITAGLILYSIVPRRDPFVAPGPLLEAAKQPRLFARLTKLAKAVGQPLPRETYLVSDVNAWVSQRGGFMGIGSRRVMGLGLPLLQVLTTSQLEAVLAHEFGHYHGGDTRLGPLIYKTRAAIGRTLQSLATDPREGFSMISLIQAPFRWYGTMYLRVTLAISRAQEFAADRLAARTIGSAALIEGLRTVHRVAGASNHYLNNEVLPVIQRGFRPPLVDGFALFLANERTAKLMDESLTAELESPDRGAYDTHPPLKDRIAALEALPAGQSSDTTPALALLDRVEDLEAQLAASWLNMKTPLKPIDWGETGGAVMVPQWRELTKRSASALEGITLENFYATAKDMDPFARKLDVWNSGVPWDSVRMYASSVLGAAFACALHDRGWLVRNSPGELWLTSGEMKLNPFQIVSDIAFGEMSEQAWRESIASFDLDRSLRLEFNNLQGTGSSSNL